MMFIQLIGKFNGKYAIIDNDDFDKIKEYRWYGYQGNSGIYACGYKKGNKIRMHRLIMNPESNMVVDHINYDTLDNRKSNLEICTSRNNTIRSRKVSSPTSSKYKGVYWHKAARKWSVIIKDKGIKEYVGIFNNEEDAAKCYDYHAIIKFGKYAHLNFPNFNYENFNYELIKKKNIYENKTSKYIGTYKCELDAAIARDKYIDEHNIKGENKKNFI